MENARPPTLALQQQPPRRPAFSPSLWKQSKRIRVYTLVKFSRCIPHFCYKRAHSYPCKTFKVKRALEYLENSKVCLPAWVAIKFLYNFTSRNIISAVSWRGETSSIWQCWLRSAIRCTTPRAASTGPWTEWGSSSTISLALGCWTPAPWWRCPNNGKVCPPGTTARLAPSCKQCEWRLFPRKINERTLFKIST